MSFLGGSCSYKRRELAKSLETRTRFPELFMQDEKHVFRFRFVVINGLSIVEEPIRMTIEEAEWYIKNHIYVYLCNCLNYLPMIPKCWFQVQAIVW